jgi:hypothetical protein
MVDQLFPLLTCELDQYFIDIKVVYHFYIYHMLVNYNLQEYLGL